MKIWISRTRVTTLQTDTETKFVNVTIFKWTFRIFYWTRNIPASERALNW